jgi:N-acetylglucosaminyldiphosphoundecaprenol N-acetyl-beta-D-mannosaminyltransferase
MTDRLFDYQFVMSYRIFDDSLQKIGIDTDRKLVINTLNPHSYVVAKKDKLFTEAINRSDIIIPDGSGIVLAAKLINRTIINKVAGTDLQDHLLANANKNNGSVFYMGSTEETLNLIKSRLAKDFPHLKVATYSPPFKELLSKEDNENIINEINKFSPDVLFIGMTAPKQEKWLHQNRDRLDFRISSCIGAAFDFYAGTIDRPSKIWINLHLEWLVRFLREPKRLFRRNFISTPLFLLDLLLYRLNIKK